MFRSLTHIERHEAGVREREQGALRHAETARTLAHELRERLDARGAGSRGPSTNLPTRPARGPRPAAAFPPPAAVRSRPAPSRADEAFEHGPHPTVLIDEGGLIVRGNDAWWRGPGAPGSEPDAVVSRGMAYAGAVLRYDVPPQASGGVSEWMHTVGAVLAGRSATGHGRIQRGEGAPRHEQTTIARMPGGGALVTHVDVTGLVERCARLEHLVRHDPLTGALNVRGLQASADAMIRDAKRHGHVVRIFAIDVDGFKVVNDRFGHATGDAVLASIAERLRASLREGDLVARVGGDEFAVVALESSGAEELHDRLRSDFGALTVPGSAPGFRLRVSLGAATFPDDGEELTALLACADSRMYRVKRRRR